MVYVLLGTGFEETEAITPVDLMRRAGISVQTVGLTDKIVTGGHGIPVEADILLSQIDLTQVEMVVLPGGLGGVASVRACPQALELLQFAAQNQKYVAAICAGPTVLADLHITDDRSAVCYPGCEKDMGSARILPDAHSVQDHTVLTSPSAGCAIPFGLMLIRALKGEHAAKKVEQQIVIR